LSFAVAPVIDAGYANLYCRDITERKKAEEERERLLKTIQIINENLQSIVYVASHDLRSPLVNIEGFSGELGETCLQLKQMLDDSSIDDDLKQKLLMLLDEDITESIKFITAGASKMALLLEGLLQVSRIGTTTVEIKPLDMDKLMNDIHQAMEFQVKKAGVELIVEHVPDCFGDKAMTNQIFSNILGNALKYLDPKRQGRIHISGRTENEMSVYCVEDNGIGIDPAHQKRIFEIFQRLNPDDDAGGEGLGLAIVVRILDRQNGHIWLESEPGKGSKFYVSLPGI
jgi:signal transduction histidine kinase